MLFGKRKSLSTQAVATQSGSKVSQLGAALQEAKTIHDSGSLPEVDVLVVDDDESFNKLVETKLRANRVSVKSVTSAGACIESLKQVDPQILLLDLNIPDINGYDLCRMLRAYKFEDISIVMCSAEQKVPYIVRGLRTGADAFLRKPVNLDELAEAVNRQLKINKEVRKILAQDNQAQDDLIFERDISPKQSVAAWVQSAIVNHNDLAVHIIGPKQEVLGTIWMQEGAPIHATTGDESGIKAFASLLAQRAGRVQVRAEKYEGKPSIVGEFAPTVFAALAYLPQPRMKQQASAGFTLAIHYSPTLFRVKLSDDMRMVLSLVEDKGSLDEVLSDPSLPEETLFNALQKLMDAGVITVA